MKELRAVRLKLNSSIRHTFTKKGLVMVGGAMLISLPVVAFAQDTNTHQDVSKDVSTAPLTTQNKTANPLPPVPSPAGASTKVTVNGQSVPVPVNGSTHQTVSTSQGNTNVDISSQSSQSGNGASHSSTTVQVNNTTDQESSHDSSSN